MTPLLLLASAVVEGGQDDGLGILRDRWRAHIGHPTSAYNMQAWCERLAAFSDVWGVLAFIQWAERALGYTMTAWPKIIAAAGRAGRVQTVAALARHLVAPRDFWDALCGVKDPAIVAVLQHRADAIGIGIETTPCFTANRVFRGLSDNWHSAWREAGLRGIRIPDIHQRHLFTQEEYYFGIVLGGHVGSIVAVDDVPWDTYPFLWQTQVRLTGKLPMPLAPMCRTSKYHALMGAIERQDRALIQDDILPHVDVFVYGIAFQNSLSVWFHLEFPPPAGFDIDWSRLMNLAYAKNNHEFFLFAAARAPRPFDWTTPVCRGDAEMRRLRREIDGGD